MSLILKKIFRIPHSETREKIFKILQQTTNKIEFIQKGIKMLMI
jgi:hypothetical protein